MKGFKNNDRIKVIPAPYAEECSYHLYELIVPDREDLLAKLAARGINCGVHYRDNTEYKVFAYGEGQAPAQEKSASISLPCRSISG